MTAPIQSTTTNWKSTLAAIIAILLWVGYWYRDTLEAMAQIWWRSETYTHGLVVPPIALWLIWRDRQRVVVHTPQATPWLTFPLAGLIFLWLLGDLTAVNSLTQFAAIGIIVTTIISLIGWRVSKTMAFPLFFLFFALPIGDFLLPHLMEWTADFTVFALRLTGIPVYREGQNFVIPSGNWSVVEACSGVRYLIASLTIGTLYAYLTYTSLQRRLVFILVSLLVPIIANWLRAYMIVMLGHISGNKLAAGVDHLIYGWIFFGVVIIIMFTIGSRWAEQPKVTENIDLPSSVNLQKPPRPWAITLLLAIIIASGPLYEAHLRQTNIAADINISLPNIIGSWNEEPSTIDWEPHFTNPSAETHSTYRSPFGWVGLYVAYYQNQNYERKLVTSTNVLVTSNDPAWQTLGNQHVSTLLGDNNVTMLATELLKKNTIADERFIVWRGYWINGNLTANDIEAKWLTAWALLTGHGDDSAVIVLYSPKDLASQSLPAFARDTGKQILQSLNEARSK